MELLFNVVVELDVDVDALGDESQDFDGGGLGMNWEDDWFEDYDDGDGFDLDFDEDVLCCVGCLWLLGVERCKGRVVVFVLCVPCVGLISAVVTLFGDRWIGVGLFLMFFMGMKIVVHVGKVCLCVWVMELGVKLLVRCVWLCIKVVVLFVLCSGLLKVLMHSVRF